MIFEYRQTEMKLQITLSQIRAMHTETIKVRLVRLVISEIREIETEIGWIILDDGSL